MPPPIDDLIITAANRAQARGYVAELRARQRSGLLDQCARWMVSPDPGGRRAGSGTATLVALQALVKRSARRTRSATPTIGQTLVQRRVLIIHSGGDSRRLPAYAAHGKIFTPLPPTESSSRSDALFDLILEDLASLEWPDGGGVVIASGDVLVDVASRRVRFSDDGVAAVSWWSTPERGSRHGVFVADADGRVRDVLQKPDAATAHARGAINARGQVLIDLGLICLPVREAAHWLDAANTVGLFENQPANMDLYGDMLPALIGVRTGTRQDTRVPRMLDAIAGHGLQTITIADSRFLHVGSTRELIAHVSHDNAVVYDSILEHSLKARGQTVVQGCWITQPLTLEGDNVLVGMPRECAVPVTLQRGTGLVCVPVGERDWATIAFGVDDDFKTPRELGGSFAGIPLTSMPEHCWDVDDGDRTLWSARLWAIGSATHSVDHAIHLLRREQPDHAADLVSSGDILSRVNHRRMQRHRDAIQRELRLRAMRNPLERQPPIDAEQAADDLVSAEEAAGVMKSLASAAHAAGAYRIADAIVRRHPKARDAWPNAPLDFAAAAFENIAQGVQVSHSSQAIARGDPIARDQAVRVTAPVRIDVAGGWSDTPPICNDVGGAVVNIAVRVDGRHPIAAEARWLDQPAIRIRSLDLQQEITLDSIEACAASQHPGDWAALPKAAIALSGLAPLVVGARGIELTIASALPKGSGLGTSSILGAATLTCLARLAGEHLSREQIIARTSALEQRMSTAGGWQDQAGGITGGAKLLVTDRGAAQIPREQPLAIPAEYWRDRVLLYSTGLQRLARDILHKVVWRWLGAGADVQRIVQRLRAGAMRMRDDLLVGDVRGFERGVNRCWELKKALDPGATTPDIERLMDSVKPWVSACTLPGAGGGGFLFMIAHDAQSARQVRAHLEAHPPNSHARFFNAEVDLQGLCVEVFGDP